MSKPRVGDLRVWHCPRSTTPHNTGRVLIGACYMQPAPSHDTDAERLQDWLLGNPRAAWNMQNWVRRVWGWL
jgi:hypothetical protein